MKTSITSIIAPLALLLLASSASGLRTDSGKGRSAYERRQQKRNKRLGGNYASYVATGCSGSDCDNWSGGGDWQGGNSWNNNHWNGGNWDPSWNHHRHHNWHGGGDWSHSYCYWNGNQYNIGERSDYCESCEYEYCYCVEDESRGSSWGQCYNN